MSRAVCRIVIALAALALAGCRSGPTEDEVRRGLEAMHANCLVIVLDAAGAGHFSTYGYDRETTPNIDRLGAAGAVFDRAHSSGVSTIVSVPSLFSGRYAKTLMHGAVDDPSHLVRAIPSVLKRDADRGSSPLRLAQAFRDAGFRTGAFSRNVVVSEAFGLNEGFDTFQLFGNAATDDSPKLVERYLTWLTTTSGVRTFGYLHFLRPHSPYAPPPFIAADFDPGYDGSLRSDTRTLIDIDVGRKSVTAADVEILRSRYDANLFYADALVERVLRGLRLRNLADRTVILVTADHGEAFGEHGRFMHNSTLYQEMMWIPMVVHLPPTLGVRPVRVAEPVSLVDVLPTLQALFDLDLTDHQVDGRSLVPLLLGAARSGPTRALFARTGPKVAVLREDHKYIQSVAEDASPMQEELYDLRADPGEKHDLSASDPELTATMRALLERFTASGPADLGSKAAAGELDPSIIDRLKKLGYIGGPDAP